MEYRKTYLFLPHRLVGEAELPVEHKVSFDEACVLAHGPYRGWRVFEESAIGVAPIQQNGAAGHAVVVHDIDDLHIK